MKWVEADNLHITLRFLGEVDEGRIPDISSAAEDAAKYQKQFKVILGRLGAFPNPRKARVFWWGLEKGAEESATLFTNLERGLVAMGFNPERKRYHPHITLARLRNPTQLPIDSFSVVKDLSFTTDGFTLFQSTLTPQGPIYKIVKEFKLDG